MIRLPVISSDACVSHEQIRKHHKKRINKKWLKRYGTKPVERCYATLIDGRMVIVVSRRMYDLLTKRGLGSLEQN